MRDFRRHPTTQGPFTSAELTQEIRGAHDRREWALELLQQLDDRPRDVPKLLDLNVDVEVAAETVRGFLRIDIEEQVTWHRESFRQWRSHIEDAGILTFEMTSVPVQEARGFSVGLRPLPVAVVNIKDSSSARVFTFLHEVAHILLDSDGICDLHEDHVEVETFCNRVAGATLFPREALVNSDVVLQHRRGSGDWSDQELQTLSVTFGASKEAALVRLTNLGLASQVFCDRRREQFRLEYRRLEAERKAKQEKGFAPPHQLALLSAGRMFVQLVVENFNRERITTSDFSDYLQIRTKHIPEVQQEYAGYGE
jgi:Zn-dependent peptidase ImmA (M78 family)